MPALLFLDLEPAAAAPCACGSRGARPSKMDEGVGAGGQEGSRVGEGVGGAGARTVGDDGREEEI